MTRALDEWILLLRGSASLWTEGEEERQLTPGDYVLIPARRIHRVTRTAADEPTVRIGSPSGRQVVSWPVATAGQSRPARSDIYST